jgi:hypothetical protein
MKSLLILVILALSSSARADVISCVQGGVGTPVRADFIDGPESTSEFQGCYLKLVKKSSSRDIGESSRSYEMFHLMSISVQPGKTECVYVSVNPDHKNDIVNCERTRK